MPLPLEKVEHGEAVRVVDDRLAVDKAGANRQLGDPGSEFAESDQGGGDRGIVGVPC